MDFFYKRSGLIVAGLIFGVLTAVLAFAGNPANMAICAACFIRDVAGSLKLHSAEPVQYFRPEIVGMVVGAFLIAIATKEYRSTAGSSPMVRFALGFIMMIGALVFLGCPLRMVIRMAAGDLNAWIGLIGFVLGTGTGAFFLNKGFSLGREYDTGKAAGAVLTVVLTLLFILAISGLIAVAASEKGPGSMHAPWILALVVAIVIGALAQKTRLCFASGFRNAWLMRDFTMLLPIAGIFVIMLVYNIATGNFHLSTAGQPIAHSQQLWNILGLYAVGFAAVLAGGCPLRQMIMAGQGSSDAAVTFLGLLVGAAFAHNFGWAGAAAAAATDTTPAVAGGPALAGQVALVVCIVVLFIIAGVNIQKKKAVVVKQVPDTTASEA
ncbi:MAG: YedE family putative selenium transporter [Coriobacteriaceae bacterium]|nr:YedE family putative selenium transporter [Coriobacteriaceae bacterium]MDO4498748.1 YedE family putative selenium transporter [Coriobacteriaceae bacterium]MDY3799471.1 YedE family putative selenium transporter [Eggerthellaceae bacterium]MDY4987557.1 YedE family putative selenium transporter [Eggerthellaceae bacterium]MDY5371528.1 YedE family putative selenium transporter [Eggerthellaceae bacterium]